MSDPYYPDGLSDWAICQIEGCIGKGNCKRCGEVNYRLLGYYGAIASAAKRWGCTEDEAEDRMAQRAQDKHDRWELELQRLINNLASVEGEAVR